jgi:protein-tyrosine sulfotransferase
MLAWMKSALTRRMASLVLRQEPRQFRSQGERLVFVGGAPRSGTTLLQHILDSHPNVYGGPEYDCIPKIIETWRRVVDSLVRGRITAFNSREQIDAAFAALIENLLLPAADDKNAELLSEKTPFNVNVFTELLELLPQCRAIHIVRDPRAVIASLLNVGRRAQANNQPVLPWAKDLDAALPFVKEALDAGFQAQQRFEERLLTLTYEALVSRPEGTIRRVCTFLNLPFDPAMLEPHAQKHPEQDAVAKLDNGTWLDPNLGFRPIEGSRVRVWQTELETSQIAAVNAAFRDHSLLRSLGYTFE